MSLRAQFIVFFSYFLFFLCLICVLIFIWICYKKRWCIVFLRRPAQIVSVSDEERVIIEFFNDIVQKEMEELFEKKEDMTDLEYKEKADELMAQYRLEKEEKLQYVYSL